MTKEINKEKTFIRLINSHLSKIDEHLERIIKTGTTICKNNTRILNPDILLLCSALQKFQKFLNGYGFPVSPSNPVHPSRLLKFAENMLDRFCSQHRASKGVKACPTNIVYI